MAGGDEHARPRTRRHGRPVDHDGGRSPGDDRRRSLGEPGRAARPPAPRSRRPRLRRDRADAPAELPRPHQDREGSAELAGGPARQAAVVLHRADRSPSSPSTCSVRPVCSPRAGRTRSTAATGRGTTRGSATRRSAPARPRSRRTSSPRRRCDWSAVTGLNCGFAAAVDDARLEQHSIAHSSRISPRLRPPARRPCLRRAVARLRLVMTPEPLPASARRRQLLVRDRVRCRFDALDRDARETLDGPATASCKRTGHLGSGGRRARRRQSSVSASHGGPCRLPARKRCGQPGCRAGAHGAASCCSGRERSSVIRRVGDPCSVFGGRLALAWRGGRDKSRVRPTSRHSDGRGGCHERDH